MEIKCSYIYYKNNDVTDTYVLGPNLVHNNIHLPKLTKGTLPIKCHHMVIVTIHPLNSHPNPPIIHLVILTIHPLNNHPNPPIIHLIILAIHPPNSHLNPPNNHPNPPSHYPLTIKSSENVIVINRKILHPLSSQRL